MHPWQMERLELERVLSTEYALGNKHELWKMNSTLKNFKDRAKKLIAARDKQSEKEKAQLIQRLQKMGLIQAGAKLDDVLGLNLKDILERRFQSMVYRRGLSRSMKQARQFIVHQHVTLSGKKISSPSHIVLKDEETAIQFSQHSTLLNPEHPERVHIEKKVKKVVKKAEKWERGRDRGRRPEMQKPIRAVAAAQPREVANGAEKTN